MEDDISKSDVYINKTYLAIGVLILFIIVQVGLIFFFRARSSSTITTNPITSPTTSVQNTKASNANSPLPLLDKNIYSSSVNYTISGTLRTLEPRVTIDAGSLEVPPLSATKDTEYFSVKASTKFPGINDVTPTNKNNIKIGDKVLLTVVYFPSSSSWVLTRISKQ